MMKLRRCAWVLTFGLGAVSAMLSGCEDSASRASAQVQKDLGDATAAFQKTIMSNTGMFDDSARQELRTLLNKLTSATTNESAGSGQKAAANALSANIHRALADSQLLSISEMRSQNRIRRAAIASMINSAERLQNIAQALASSDAEAQIAMLTEERGKAEAALRSEQSEVSTIEPSLQQLQAKIDEARQQVQGLREQENQLRRQASELGHSQGFATYEQAVAVRRQADAIEMNTSHDELSRDFEFEPMVSQHEMRIEQIEKLIASIDLAIEELRANRESSQALSNSIRKDLDTLVQRLGEEVDAMIAAEENDLKPAIDAVAMDLQATATKANSAASAAPATGNTARLTAAAAQAELGQLHAARADALSQRASLLQQIVDANLPGAAAKYRPMISDARQGHDTAVQEAVASFTSAIEMYDRVTGSAAGDIVSLRHELETRIASLTGQAPPSAPSMDDAASTDVGADTGASSTPAAPMSSAQGADSPEALAAAIGSLTDAASELHIFDYMIPQHLVNFRSPAERGVAEGMAEFAGTMRSLAAAMQSSFNVSATDALAPLAAMMDDGDRVTGASVTQTAGDSAELSVQFSMSGERSVKASQIDGRWYIGTTDDFSGGFFGDEVQMQLANPQMAQMATQMIKSMSGAVSPFISRVQNGEFSTIDEAHAAIGEAVMAAMSSMMPQGMMPQQ